MEERPVIIDSGSGAPQVQWAWDPSVEEDLRQTGLSAETYKAQILHIANTRGRIGGDPAWAAGRLLGGPLDGEPISVYFRKLGDTWTIVGVERSREQVE